MENGYSFFVSIASVYKGTIRPPDIRNSVALDQHISAMVYRSFSDSSQPRQASVIDFP